MGTTYVVPGLATLQALRGHSGRISYHETSHTLPGLMVEKEPPSLQSSSPHRGDTEARSGPETSPDHTGGK